MSLWKVIIDAVEYTDIANPELYKTLVGVNYFKFKSKSDLSLDSVAEVYFNNNKVLDGIIVEKVDKSGSWNEYTIYETAYELNGMLVDYGGKYRDTWINESVDSMVDKILANSNPPWTRGSSESTIIPSITYEYVEKLKALYKLLWEMLGRVVWFDNVDRIVYFSDVRSDYTATPLTYLTKKVKYKNIGSKPDKIIVLGAGDGINQLYAERGSGYRVKTFVYKDLKTQEEVDKVADQLYNEYVLSDDREITLTLDRSYYYLNEGDMVNVDGENFKVYSVRIRNLVEVVLNKPEMTVGSIVKDVLRGIEPQSYFAQGVTNVANFGGWETAIDSSHPAKYKFYLPDESVGFIRVNECYINVYGRAYRIWSKGSAAGSTGEDANWGKAYSSTVHTVFRDTEYESVETGVWTEIGTTTLNFSKDVSQIYTYVTIWFTCENPEYGGRAEYKLRLRNATTEEVYVTTPYNFLHFTTTTSANHTLIAYTPTGTSGTDTIAVDIYWDSFYRYGASSGNDYAIADVYAFVAAMSKHDHGTHVHDPEPGIYETSNYPSNVVVKLYNTSNPTGVVVANSTSYPELAGGSEFSATKIDITDYVAPGENTIEVTSDSLGTIQVDGFYRIFVETSK